LSLRKRIPGLIRFDPGWLWGWVDFGSDGGCFCMFYFFSIIFIHPRAAVLEQ